MSVTSAGKSDVCAHYYAYLALCVETMPLKESLYSSIDWTIKEIWAGIVTYSVSSGVCRCSCCYSGSVSVACDQLHSLWSALCLPTMVALPLPNFLSSLHSSWFWRALPYYVQLTAPSPGCMGSISPYGYASFTCIIILLVNPCQTWR